MIFVNAENHLETEQNIFSKMRYDTRYDENGEIIKYENFIGRKSVQNYAVEKMKDYCVMERFVWCALGSKAKSWMDGC